MIVLLVQYCQDKAIPVEGEKKDFLPHMEFELNDEGPEGLFSPASPAPASFSQ